MGVGYFMRCRNAVRTCMCAPVYVYVCVYVNEVNSAGHLNNCFVAVFLRINRFGRFHVSLDLFCKPRLHFAWLCLSARCLRRCAKRYIVDLWVPRDVPKLLQFYCTFRRNGYLN